MEGGEYRHREMKADLYAHPTPAATALHGLGEIGDQRNVMRKGYTQHTAGEADTNL